MTQRLSVLIDKSAIGLSGLCLVHCLAGTLLLAIVSAGGSAFFGHNIHHIGLMLAVPLAVLGLARGVARHGRWVVVTLGGLGIAAMSLALIVGHGAGEVLFTVVGVTLVGLAHIFNIRWLRH